MGRRLYRLGCALLGLALCGAVMSEAGADEDFRKIEIVGTAFRITRADGTVLSGSDLIGQVLTLGDSAGRQLRFRIDDFQPDPEDPEGEITLYRFASQDPATGAWKPLCRPDADGLAMGFPLSGTWTPAGEHVPSERSFSLTCTSGASAKCVRMGYKPWRTAPDGTSLWAYHQACTRLMRADYCGDGRSYTEAGTPVLVYDRLGIRSPDPDITMAFEAAWGTDGAICVRRVRVPDKASLDALVRACPGQLEGNVGPECTEAAAARSPATLLMNRSR